MAESVPSVLESKREAKSPTSMPTFARFSAPASVNLIWPAYLALVRTMLSPPQRQGRLNALTLSFARLDMRMARFWRRNWNLPRRRTRCRARSRPGDGSSNIRSRA